MDLSNDLRQTYDVSENPALAQFDLQTRSPPVTTLQSVGHTTLGLDCLLIVIRRLYSYLFARYSARSPVNLAAEAENPILQMAWQDFGEESAQDWPALKRQILERFNPTEAFPQEIWFENLCFSPLMLKTFWSRPEHHLYRVRLVKSGSLWSRLEWAEEDLVRQSTMVVDQKKAQNLTFQEHIDQNFGWKKQDDGTEALYACRRPPIARIKYTKDKGLEPFPFQDIKNIRLPIAGADKDENYIPVASRSLYTLLAAVFLVKTGQNDCVRTYEFVGSELVLSPSGPFCAGRSRSLQTQESGKVMLFYAHSKDDSMIHSGYGEFASRPIKTDMDAAINAMSAEYEDEWKR
ncbi:hypothetical protein FALBO_5364 [Fusarium albosuccineum]|uniref:Uncharacterized protein n=1 Tax=Fusarium albosuccineum TaxID=1237068 RepID=A0A8H4LHV1_9HYPO|nr:hypothetical protein FALBO_5364 [Fusarium albosuccineum]